MGWWGRSDYYYKPYVSADERRRRAEKAAAKRFKSGGTQAPVRLEGKAIARSFWGKAWCDNLESYSDYSNRMPRGRTYVRNGSVIHLEIRQGEIEALVSGSRLYTVKIAIAPVRQECWKALCRECAGGIGSLMELLGGKLSQRVMEIMTRRNLGLFPSPKEIKLDCSCPDWAEMCKHVAAALYGVGARLDEKPELLFLLRHVSHQDLVSGSSAVTALTGTKTGADHATLSTAEINDVFGIELQTTGTAAEAPAPGTAGPCTAARVKAKRSRRKSAKKPAAGELPGRMRKRKSSKVSLKRKRLPRWTGKAT
ncbi:MAG TPA: hypothetical protein DCL44_07725 [Elusimicrobia bacterium]|nr:hypothetical protein [Elusimicrobiota bacterium]